MLTFNFRYLWNTTDKIVYPSSLWTQRIHSHAYTAYRMKMYSSRQYRKDIVAHFIKWQFAVNTKKKRKFNLFQCKKNMSLRTWISKRNYMMSVMCWTMNLLKYPVLYVSIPKKSKKMKLSSVCSSQLKNPSLNDAIHNTLIEISCNALYMCGSTTFESIT